MFNAAKQDRFKAYLSGTSLVVLTAFLFSSVIFPQKVFAQVFNLNIMPLPAVKAPVQGRLDLSFRLNPKIVEQYNGNLRPMTLKGEKFFLTGASFYWPGEGKASQEHMGSVLTPGISAANLDFPLGTILDVYDPDTGEFLYRRVVADRGPFGVEKVQMPLIGEDDYQVKDQNGRPVFKTKVVPRRDDDGNLVRNAKRGIDIHVATAKEAFEGGERPVLLKVIWEPDKKKPEGTEELPLMMMDADMVQAPADNLRVLDVRLKRVVLEDQAGRLLTLWDLKDIAVKVGQRLSKGGRIGLKTAKTTGASFIDGTMRPIHEWMAFNTKKETPSGKPSRLMFALFNAKFIREEAALTL